MYHTLSDLQTLVKKQPANQKKKTKEKIEKLAASSDNGLPPLEDNKKLGGEGHERTKKERIGHGTPIWYCLPRVHVRPVRIGPLIDWQSDRETNTFNGQSMLLHQTLAPPTYYQSLCPFVRSFARSSVVRSSSVKLSNVMSCYVMSYIPFHLILSVSLTIYLHLSELGSCRQM